MYTRTEPFLFLAKSNVGIPILIEPVPGVHTYALDRLIASRVRLIRSTINYEKIRRLAEIWLHIRAIHKKYNHKVGLFHMIQRGFIYEKNS